MMAGGGGSAVAGGPAPHIPVLGRPAVELLGAAQAASTSTARSAPAGIRARSSTRGGCSVIGIDRDQTAIAGGADLVEQAKGRLTLVEDRFSNLERSRASRS